MKVNPYVVVGKQIGELLIQKQKAYGDSFGKTQKFLLLLYPNGIPTDQMGTALALVRIWDKMSRIATNNDPFGENPFKDIAGYSILEVVRRDKEKFAKQIKIVRTKIKIWDVTKIKRKIK